MIRADVERRNDVTGPPGRSGIRPAVATICFDGFGDEDFAPTFESVGELGITDIEFNCWYPRNLTPQGLDSIVRRSASAGLEPVCLQIISPAPSRSFGGAGAEVARWMWLLEAAERIGARVIKTTGSKRDGDGADLGQVIEVLRDVTPVAKDRGLTIAIENHFDNTFEKPEDYRRLFDEIDSPALGLCLDTGHFAASGVDMISLIDEFAERLVHIDLKDCAREGEASFVPFGEGIVDFDAVLSRAASAGYEGYLIVEYPRADESRTLEHLRVGADIARRHSTAQTQ
jgi:sugar phosphate isomerase/epimerase